MAFFSLSWSKASISFLHSFTIQESPGFCFSFFVVSLYVLYFSSSSDFFFSFSLQASNETRLLRIPHYVPSWRIGGFPGISCSVFQYCIQLHGDIINILNVVYITSFYFFLETVCLITKLNNERETNITLINFYLR